MDCCEVFYISKDFVSAISLEKATDINWNKTFSNKYNL